MNNSISQERRKHKRWNLVFAIPIIETSTQQTIGQMEEISSGGFRLNSQYEIPVGNDYHLGLITNIDSLDMEFVGFVARSKWCQTSKYEFDQSQYSVGFDIIKIAAQDAQMLQCIAEKNRARDLSSVIPG